VTAWVRKISCSKYSHDAEDDGDAEDDRGVAAGDERKQYGHQSGGKRDVAPDDEKLVVDPLVDLRSEVPVLLHVGKGDEILVVHRVASRRVGCQRVAGHIRTLMSMSSSTTVYPGAPPMWAATVGQDGRKAGGATARTQTIWIDARNSTSVASTMAVGLVSAGQRAGANSHASIDTGATRRRQNRR